MAGTQSDRPSAASQVDHLAAALANKAGGISQARLSALELNPARSTLERLLLILAALDLELVVQPRRRPTEPAEL